MAEEIKPAPVRSGHKNRTIALVLIGIGALILLSNIGALSAALWSLIWPLGMLAVGLDLITQGRQRRRITIYALAALVLLTPLIAGSQLLDRDRGGFQRRERVEQFALADVDRVRATIAQTAGDLEIEALRDRDTDVVQVSSDGAVTSYTTQGRVGVLEIAPDTRWGVGDLDVELTPNVPLDLRIDVAAGSADPLDFRGLQLERLDLTLGAGDTSLILPERGAMEITVNGTIGEIEITIPDELAARVEVQTDLGELDYDEDRFRSEDGVLISENYRDDAPNRATIRINAGPGEVTIK